MSAVEGCGVFYDWFIERACEHVSADWFPGLPGMASAFSLK